MEEIHTLSVQGTVPEVLKAELIQVMAPYYEHPEAVLEYEIKYGDTLYYTRTPDTLEVGAFLIVNHAPLTFSSQGASYRGCYGGQGAAKTQSIQPLFLKTKTDLQTRLQPGEKGIIYLTTASPYVFRGLSATFKTGIFPTATPSNDDEHNQTAEEIATLLRERIFRQTTPAQESPFVLRGYSAHRYSPDEAKRIATFKGPSPPQKYGIDPKKGDRLIAFHLFS